jgi:hypothetical protein
MVPLHPIWQAKSQVSGHRADHYPCIQIMKASTFLECCLPTGLAIANRAVEQGGAVLVQCWGGVMRAPSLAVALLMWVQHVHVVSAVEMVMAVRGEILTKSIL